MASALLRWFLYVYAFYSSCVLWKLFQQFFCAVFHKQFSVCFGSWVVYLVGGEYMWQSAV